MLLHAGGDIAELLVDRGHDLFELGDLLGSAHAGDDIFALGVEQELAVELLGAGGGIAGESDAGAGGVSHVAEDHGLDVDGGAEHVIDVVHAAIVLGAVILPGAEDGVAGHHELIIRILRKINLGVLLDDLFVLGDDFLQGLGIEVGVKLGFLLLLLVVEDLFEVRLLDIENYVAEHLDEAAVGIVGEARVLGALGESLDALIVEAEVEDRIHHAGHGELCAGTDGDEQGIGTGAELLALQGFKLLEGGVHLLVHVFTDLAAHVLATGFGLNGESRRNRETSVGHLSKTGALATEGVLHLAVAFGLAAAEGINVLDCTDCGSSHSLTLWCV